jgi:proteasome lid subunit RPN8/RPN11
LSTPFRLLLPLAIYEEMIRQAQAELPNECCGLLAGHLEGGVAEVIAIYPVVNERASPTAYLTEPRSMLAANKDVDRRGLRVVAIYHSHPKTRPFPSRSDLDNNYWGLYAMHFIVSLASEPPSVAAWWLGPGEARPAEWAVDDRS